MPWQQSVSICLCSICVCLSKTCDLICVRSSDHLSETNLLKLQWFESALDIHLWTGAASLWAQKGGVGYETQQGSASPSTPENWELLETSLGAWLGGLAQRRQSRTEEAVYVWTVPKSTNLFTKRNYTESPKKKNISFQNQRALTVITSIKEGNLFALSFLFLFPSCRIFQIMGKECFRCSSQFD